MNIFYLSSSPKIAAEFLCDKHVVKMVLESAQLLCTTHRVLDQSTDDILYKQTHTNHPSAIWVRESIHNYTWLYRHFTDICTEYTFRYGKVHKCETNLKERLKSIPRYIPYSTDFTPPPMAMPDIYKKILTPFRDMNVELTMKAYRDYYYYDKVANNIAQWNKSRPEPFWIQEYRNKDGIQ